ncbi:MULTISPECIES: DUF445 family protein [unclassified Rossellomorea]|uniref:DUF445 domain-containing protein n=1 Tax=unclassified Rossellomorea TaxID=2837526 RepID=UPI0020C6B244|nr:MULTISPECIES: DUF445 family protein [unclassified Rossellomorea]UTE79016.1 DUF445 family protein [Rossellomorea sp. KS-H15a]WGG47078.1 DUF445 family protein [Rossellomorea sp. DA94]
MLDAFILVLFMVIVGALIGGVTNSLAIKMLFRPYRAYYIGKFKVPFTPGLIPKRRGELAEQLGKMVVDHLITPESLQKKVMNEDFQKDVTLWLSEELQPVFTSDKTVNEWLDTLQIPVSSDRLNEWLEDWVAGKIKDTKMSYTSMKLEEALPERWQEKVSESIPKLVDFIANRAEAYFTSPEGKMKVKIMIDDFLKERGMLGNMLGMFLGNTSVADKVQPEIVKFIKHEGTQEILFNLLTQEWSKLKQMKLEEFIDRLPEEDLIQTVQSSLVKLVNIDGHLSKPLRSWLEPHKQTFFDIQLPKWVDRGTDLLSRKIPNLMEKMHLQHIVQEQVESFSVGRLEELVLGISRREFKMITYLGALLGGVIGIIQGLIALFIS